MSTLLSYDHTYLGRAVGVSTNVNVLYVFFTRLTSACLRLETKEVRRYDEATDVRHYSRPEPPLKSEAVTDLRGVCCRVDPRPPWAKKQKVKNIIIIDTFFYSHTKIASPLRKDFQIHPGIVTYQTLHSDPWKRRIWKKPSFLRPPIYFFAISVIHCHIEVLWETMVVFVIRSVLAWNSLEERRKSKPTRLDFVKGHFLMFFLGVHRVYQKKPPKFVGT